MARIALAALASMLALPLLVLLGLVVATGSPGWGPVIALMMLVVIAPHVLLLGIPAFLALHRWGRLGAGSMAFAGFLAGAVPAGLYAWPYWRFHPGHDAEREWHGTVVATARDGVPTIHGVLVHLETVFILGAMGAASALVFWLCWRYLQRRAGLPLYPPAAPRPERP